MSLEEFDVEEYTEMIKEDSFNEGKAEGDLVRGIRTAKRMRERGDDIAYIADTLRETEEQIEKWLAMPSYE